MEKENTPESMVQEEKTERKPWKTPSIEKVNIAGFTMNQIGTGGDGECAYVSHS